MQIDWSESPGGIYNKLVDYYQYDFSQRNVYLFGEERLIDLGEYEVVSMDSVEKKLSLASYSYNGDTRTVEKIKQVKIKPSTT